MLFQRLSAEQQQLTDNLRGKIIAAIKGNSAHAISMSNYLELALYDPEYGYYNNALHKFGRQGDFITAPMVSNLFASCMARQVRDIWSSQMPNITRCKADSCEDIQSSGTLVHEQLDHNLLEIGLGNGQLMLNLLPLLAEQLDHYYVFERSPVLVNLSKQRLEEHLPKLAHKVVWLNQLPSEFHGIILANEVLDAQPCEVIVWERGVAKIRNVSVNIHEKFGYVDSTINSSALKQLVEHLPVIDDQVRYVSEVSVANRTWIKEISESLHTGYIILIDYGYTMVEYYSAERCNGTLRGFFQHQLVDDILSYPGLIDITSSVDFSSIAKSAVEHDLTVFAYLTQGNFLLNCGILDIVEQEQLDTTTMAYYKRAQEIQQLTSAHEMGDIFKVMILGKNVQFTDLLGLSHNNRLQIL